MGDRAPAQLIIHSTAPEDVPSILAFVDEWGLQPDWGTEGSSDDQVRVGTTYGDSDTSIGIVYQCELSKHATRTYYTLWSNPKYEFNGSLEIFVPELGLYGADCDSDGHPLISLDEGLTLLNGHPQDITVAQWRPVLERALGKPWYDAIAALGEQPEVVKADWKAHAHRHPIASPQITIAEDSDRGTDQRFQAVCQAESGTYACDFAGPWRHVDQYLTAEAAYQDAENDGRIHLDEQGVQQ